MFQKRIKINTKYTITVTVTVTVEKSLFIKK